MTRVCVFVDGENFRHSLGGLFDTEFDTDDYLPRNGKWSEFFNYLTVEAAGHAGTRLRTYWYVIQHLDFHPYNLPSTFKDAEKLRKILEKNENFKTGLGGLEGQDLENKLNEIRANLRGSEDRMKRRFEGWTTIQNSIATRCDAVEFRRAGAITYNLYTGEFGKEKAVDVKLGIDMILLREIFDMAVIVSGDQDYVPASEAIKDFGKAVVNCSFLTRSGKQLPGGAWRLNVVTDKSISIPYAKMKALMAV